MGCAFKDLAVRGPGIVGDNWLVFCMPSRNENEIHRHVYIVQETINQIIVIRFLKYDLVYFKIIWCPKFGILFIQIINNHDE